MASSKKKPQEKNTGRAGDGVEYLGVREDGKKYWRVRLFWVDPRTGKDCETKRVVQADSKLLAQQKRAALIEEERAGDKPTERVRFSRASEEWFATVKAAGSRVSWGCHRRALDAHFREWWLGSISARDIQRRLDATMRGSPGYANSRLDVMRHILDFAKTEGWVATNVAKEVKRRSTRGADLNELGEAPMRALTEDEVLVYLADLRKHEPELYPVVLTQLVLGCRFAEVSALHLEDVDLETGIVKIRRGQYRGHRGRTKGKYARSVALPLSARVMLKAHLARMADEQWPGSSELVFPRPPHNRRRHSDHWSISTASYAIARSFKRCGFTITGKTHVARHTMVTLTDGYASASLMQKVVGHSSDAIHSNYKHAHVAKVIELAEVVGKRVLSEAASRTGTLTGTTPSRGGSKRKETP